MIKKLRLSNRFLNQTKATVCLNSGLPTSQNDDGLICKRNVLVSRFVSKYIFPKQPSVQQIGVKNLPLPVEDVSFWESVVR